MQVQSLGWEDPLEEGMSTHSGILFFFFFFNENPETLIGSESYLSRTWAVYSSLQHQFLLRGYFPSHLSVPAIPDWLQRCSKHAHTSVSIRAHSDFWFPVTFPTTALYPRRFHSQKVTYPSPPHHTLEKPGVPSQAPPPAFFWKAVKMLKLFRSSSFFPSLVLFFSTSLVVRVISAAGKSPWVTTFPMILRYRLAHFLLVSFTLTSSPAPASRGTGRLR